MMIMKFVSLCMSVCMYEEKRRQGHQILLLQMFIFFCFHDCMIPSASLYFPFSWYWYVLIVLLCKRSQRICTMIYAWKTFFSISNSPVFLFSSPSALSSNAISLRSQIFLCTMACLCPLFFSFAFSCCNAMALGLFQKKIKGKLALEIKLLT